MTKWWCNDKVRTILYRTEMTVWGSKQAETGLQHDESGVKAVERNQWYAV